MSPESFCYWLMGYVELADPEAGLTEQQLDTVERHLRLVFADHIDPKAGGPEQQAKLNEIHSPLDVVQPGSLGPVRPDMNSQPTKPIVHKWPKSQHPFDGVKYRC